MADKDFFKRLAEEFKTRNNPTDLKAAFIGQVAQLEPLTIQIEDGKILLIENKELEISEWFKFRCNINKDNSLSDSVTKSLNAATQIKETHSNGGTPCNIPTAIEQLANATKEQYNDLKTQLNDMQKKIDKIYDIITNKNN